MNRWLLLLAVLMTLSAPGQELFERKWLANLPMGLAGIERASNGDLYLSATIYDNFMVDTAASIAMKFNSNYELQWSKHLKTLSDDDFGSLKILSDGDILYGGGTGANFSPLLGGSLYKLTPDGNVLWSRLYPGSNDDRISAIHELENGNLILGVRRGVSGQPMRFLLTDAQGNIQEQFIIAMGEDELRPESLYFEGNTIYGMTTVFDQELGYDVLIMIAFNAEEILWAKTFDAGLDVFGGVIYPNPNDGFTILARLIDPNSGVNGTDIWMFTLDSQGNTGWSKRIYRPGNGFSESGGGIVFLPGGDLLLSQSHQSELGTVPVISRFNAQGNPLWIKRNDGASSFYFEALSDDVVLMAGRSADGGLVLGTSTIDGVTACGTSNTEVSVEDQAITSAEVEVVFGASNLEETTDDFIVYDFPLTMEEYCNATVGRDETREIQASIFPNPTEDMLYLELDNPNSQVIIRDVSGRELIRKSLSNQITQFDLSTFARGIYLVEVDGRLVEKVVVR